MEEGGASAPPDDQGHGGVAAGLMKTYFHKSWENVGTKLENATNIYKSAIIIYML